MDPTLADTHPRIMWHSNAPWVGTGYGSQTALFVPRIAERLDYEIAISAFYGLKGARQGWTASSKKPYVVYPGGRNTHGNDVLGSHAKHFFSGRGGIVIALTDPWVLDYQVCAKLPMAAWVPVDHDPLMPRTAGWFARTNAIPVAMSRFGEEKLTEAGFEPLYVPHGFDESIFTTMDRLDARRHAGLPRDAFVVGMVAANKGFPSRKGFDQAIRAFSIFQKRHKDSMLYLHTQMEEPDGENLPALCENEGVRAMSSDPYAYALGYPPAFVALLMNAFDVLLNPSWGEGFGVPLIEAQACGTPCITTNFSSMPEVAPVAEGNWSVGGQSVWTPFESRQMTASVDDIVDALETAYAETTEERIARREAVYAWAHAEYEADYITDTYWKPVLEEIEARLAWESKKVVRR